jgi:MFS family permease
MRALAHLIPPALQKPRFRLFALGQVISILGSWVQQVALAWLVYRLTHSVFLLGLTGFMLQIPHLLIAPMAGLVVDRLPRVRLLIAVNVTLSFLALGLAALAFQEAPDVRLLIAVAFLVGIANACESPTRQSLVGAIVEDRTLLPSAIGFNSVIFNTGRLIGPAIAGVLLLRVPEAWCFLLNAVTFYAVIAALIAMRLPDTPPTAPSGARPRFRESVARLAELPVARYLMPSASAVALFALPLTQLMPSIVVAFFGGDQGTVGLCMSASGFGALTSALFLAWQRGNHLQLALVRIAPLAGGCAMVLFSQSRTLWLSLPLLSLISACSLATSASTNTLLQQSVDDAWRGRVIGFYIMFFIGIAPLGNLLAGTIAARIGLTPMLVLNGCMIALAAIVAEMRLRANPGALSHMRESLGMSAARVRSKPAE